jgi:hypothetical protein
MSLVNAMIQQGATIPEISEVLAASERLQAPNEFTADELFAAEAIIDDAAERYLGIGCMEDA